MTDQFDPTWPHGHVTRDGEWDAEILRSDLKRECPIVSVITSRSTGDQRVLNAHSNGQFWLSSQSTFDLLNAPAPKKKYWVNVYERDTPFSNSYSDRRQADLAAQRDTGIRIACIEVEEGQGLSREDDPHV